MPEKEDKIDLDYCLILIDKVSNPSLSEQDVSYLLKDLADCARYVWTVPTVPKLT